MFRIAICDDSKYDMEELSSALESLHSEGIEYELSYYSNGLKLIKDFEEGKRYHLLILDMVMEPINGIDTAIKIRENDVSMPILIVTSTMEFALEGYRVNAWRYLTKPINEEKFLHEVREIYHSLSQKDQSYFVIENDSGMTKLHLDDILYFDSNLHTITVHTVKQNFSFRGTIRKIEEEYAPSGFFRIHKSYVVNLRHIHRVSKLSVVMVNGETLDLSKLRAAALHEALLDYAGKSHRR